MVHITLADWRFAAPSCIFKAQSSRKSIKFKIALALVKSSCSVIRSVGGQRELTMLNLLWFAAIHV